VEKFTQNPPRCQLGIEIKGAEKPKFSGPGGGEETIEKF
jgi:hypothetical protein